MVDNIYASNYYKSMNKLLVKNISGEKILVMGCHADNDAEQFSNKNILLIEPVDSFVEKYKEKFKEFKNIRVKKMEWENININENFDCVTCCDCIEHSKEPFKILEKIVTMSNKVIITCPNGFWNFQDKHRFEDHGHGAHINKFQRRELKKFFESKGFNTTIKGIRYSWLGRFSFGIFLIAEK